MNYLRQYQQEEMTADYYDRKIQEREERLEREYQHIQEEQEEMNTLRETRKRISELIRTYGSRSTQVGEEYDFYSDYHKDVFGVRPHFYSEEEFVAYFCT